MMRKGCTPRLMLEALAAAGGSLPELVTGGRRDYATRSDLMVRGLVQRAYVLTDAGREALAHADDPLINNPHGIGAVHGRSSLDATNMPTALPWWGGHLPQTDPEAVAKIEQEAIEARAMNTA